MDNVLAKALIVICTCYHAVASQCNEDCLTTASGAKICCTDSAYTHRYMAVSRDLLKDYPYGTKVNVACCEVEEYNGVWTITDTMNKRYENAVDLLINPDMPLFKSNILIEKIE